MLGQQVVASIPLMTGHSHEGIIGQLMGVEVGEQAGHFPMGQQVVGSSPPATGC